MWYSMASFYIRIFGLLLTIYVTCAVSPAIPKPGHKNRVADRPLSEKLHFEGNGKEIHNMEFDHEAFLGLEESKKFDEMTPAESKEKLGLIFLKIDRDGDAHLSEEELHNWMKLVQQRNTWTETDRQWTDLNPTKEEFVSWEVYEKYNYGASSDEEDGESAKRDKRRWELADVDGNKLLSRSEFNMFIHPEQAEHMKHLIVEDTLEDVDQDKDGVISFEEYMSDVVGEEDDEDDEDDSWIREEEEEFRTELDQNQDGVLDSEEMNRWLIPDEMENIVEETVHLFSEADHDKDGLLSADEVIGNYELFVGSQITDYGNIFSREEL